MRHDLSPSAGERLAAHTPMCIVQSSASLLFCFAEVRMLTLSFSRCLEHPTEVGAVQDAAQNLHAARQTKPNEWYLLRGLRSNYPVQLVNLAECHHRGGARNGQPEFASDLTCLLDKIGTTSNRRA